MPGKQKVVKETGTLLLLSSLAFFSLYLGMYFSGSSVWDDSYIFSRYADNLLQSGVPSWNPGGDPSFGLTSQLHLLPVALTRLAGGSPALSLYLSSFLTGLLFVFSLAFLLWKYGKRYGNILSIWFGSLLLAMNAPLLVQHFSSGMDTCLALFWITAYLILWKRFEKSLSPGKALILGLWGGAAALVRPDLLLFSFVLPGMIALFTPKKIVRREAMYTLLFTSFTVLSLMVAGDRIYGSFFPLPFLIKSNNPYGPSIAEVYRWTPWVQFGQFALHNALPLLGLVLAFLFRKRVWRLRFSLLDRGMMLAAFLFCVYYLFFVVQIMGYASRFYYPLMPILAYLGLKSWGLLLQGQESWKLWFQNLSTPNPSFRVLGASLLVYLLLLLGHRYPENLSAKFGKFSIESVYNNLGKHNWPMLDRFSFLPDDLAIGTTEIGIPSAMNPHKKIVDLAGLTDHNLASAGANVVDVLQKHHPDLLYMPHPHYREMNEQLRQSAFFQENYLLFPADSLQSYLGIALLKPSQKIPAPYFYQLKQMVEEEITPHP